MIGLYIHIPFCTKKCGYCDFYSISGTKYISDFVDVLCIELKERSINNNKLSTIYFGGGTPSVLNIKDLNKIISTIYKYYDTSELNEFTFEINPDDITKEYINGLLSLNINRLSIGIQSFNDDYLKIMNRRHNAQQAIDAIKLSQKQGFKNISIDLIYGLPKLNNKIWKNTIEKAIDMNVEHISAYHLTYEPNTVFYKKLQKGEFAELPDEDSINQYNLLKNKLKKADYLNYEISSFSKKGYESKHNSSYWYGKEYIGVGPAAHSFDGKYRRYNISNIKKYITKIKNKETDYYEQELLSDIDKYNEYIMLGLRTDKGIKKSKLYDFNNQIINHFNIEKNKNLNLKNIDENENMIFITEEKKFLTDSIISSFFYV